MAIQFLYLFYSSITLQTRTVIPSSGPTSTNVNEQYTLYETKLITECTIGKQGIPILGLVAFLGHGHLVEIEWTLPLKTLRVAVQKNIARIQPNIPIQKQAVLCLLPQAEEFLTALAERFLLPICLAYRAQNRGPQDPLQD